MLNATLQIVLCKLYLENYHMVLYRIRTCFFKKLREGRGERREGREDEVKKYALSKGRNTAVDNNRVGGGSR